MADSRSLSRSDQASAPGSADRGPGFLGRLRAFLKVAARGQRAESSDPLRLLRRRPALLLAVSGYELALLTSNRLDARLKYLASVKASGLVGCPF